MRRLSLDNTGQGIQHSQCEPAGQQCTCWAGGVPRPLWPVCQRQVTEDTVSHTTVPPENQSCQSPSKTENVTVFILASYLKHLGNLRKIHQSFCVVLEKGCFSFFLNPLELYFPSLKPIKLVGCSLRVPNQILSTTWILSPTSARASVLII